MQRLLYKNGNRPPCVAQPDRRHEKVALKAGELLSGAGAAGVGGAGALRSP